MMDVVLNEMSRVRGVVLDDLEARKYRLCLRQIATLCRMKEEIAKYL